MNKLARIAAASFTLLAMLSLASTARGQGKKNAAGEEFFIISSVDLKDSQLLLKRPTEVTIEMKVTPTTKMFDEQHKPVHISDFRAGDTIWAIASTDSSGELVASNIRVGPMTVQELHALYLDYPVIQP
ncbi:MAG TPA: hypothetical protein VMU43_05075 [Candidatus Acidoferrum sp.]|nr:hypothetical protein [Candidatus Acidoferrum sp.]